MIKAIGLLLLGAGGPLLGCSNTNAACGTLSATYADNQTLTSAISPTCSVPSMAMITTGTVSITGAGPDHEVTVPGIQGPCPATSDGCSLDLQCSVNITDPSGNAAGSAKFTANWSFTTTGFTGPSSLVVQETDGSVCTFTFMDAATKQ
jgi:hypothetical protein